MKPIGEPIFGVPGCRDCEDTDHLLHCSICGAAAIAHDALHLLDEPKLQRGRLKEALVAVAGFLERTAYEFHSDD
jgi:hypothetical protein